MGLADWQLWSVQSVFLKEIPDEFVLIGVVEGHEHLGVLSDLTHHVLQRHKESKGWRGGKLGLSTQIQILSLRLAGVKESTRERETHIHRLALIRGVFILGLIEGPGRITYRNYIKEFLLPCSNSFSAAQFHIYHFCACRLVRWQVLGSSVCLFVSSIPLERTLQVQEPCMFHHDLSVSSPVLKVWLYLSLENPVSSTDRNNPFLALTKPKTRSNLKSWTGHVTRHAAPHHSVIKASLFSWPGDWFSGQLPRSHFTNRTELWDANWQFLNRKFMLL